MLSERPQRLSVSSDQVRLRNILLATDFSVSSARTLGYALGIADRYQAQLYLFHCIDPAPYSLVDREVLWRTRDDAQSQLESLIPDLHRQNYARNIEVKVLAEVGDPADFLTQAVKSLDLGLIVVGTHGRTGWEKLALGSVAEVVIKKVSCPVLSVGPSANRTRIQEFGPESILLVSEPSGRSQIAESYAFSLAGKYGSRLAAVDILENRYGRVVAQVSNFRWSDAELNHSIPDTEPAHVVRTAPQVGTQSDLVLQMADQIAADLIVLAVPEPHRFPNRFVSTNSYRVVCGASCPVLTVHAL
jgi:nucleotide-binding universal stress UspA family protein